MASKLRAPENAGPTNISGTIYEPGEDGLVTVHVPDHEATLRRHGYTSPEAPRAEGAPKPEFVPRAKAAEHVPDRAPVVPNVFHALEQAGLQDGVDFTRDCTAVALLTLLDGVISEQMAKAGVSLKAPPAPENVKPGASNGIERRAFLKTELKSWGVNFNGNATNPELEDLYAKNNPKPPQEA